MIAATHPGAGVADLLILGQLDAATVGRLARSFGVLEVLAPDELERAPGLEEVRAIVVRSPFRVDAALIRRCPRLRAIVRAGSGTDNIDLEAAAGRGIRVFTTPMAGRSVAELAFGLALAVARQIPRLHHSLAAGEWRKWAAVGSELGGKTLTVVGFGRIGRSVASLAKGFGMEVLVVDRSPGTPEKSRALRAVAGRATTLDAALPRTDVLVLCCPLTAETRRMIGAEELGRLPPRAILVNVARDQLVDTPALLDALRSGRLGGAGIDGFADRERATRELAADPRVVVTPHIGAQTLEGHDRIGREVERILGGLLDGEHP